MTHKIPPEVRAIIQARDTICGIWACMVMDRYGQHIGSLDIHHIQSFGSTREDDPDNLITLCRKHHNMAHNGLIKSSVLRDAIKVKNLRKTDIKERTT